MVFCTVLSSHEFTRVVYFILVVVNSLNCEFIITWVIQFIDKAAGLSSLGCICSKTSQNRSIIQVDDGSSKKVFGNRRVFVHKCSNSWLFLVGTARREAKAADSGGMRRLKPLVWSWLARPALSVMVVVFGGKGCESGNARNLRAVFVFKNLPSTLTGGRERKERVLRLDRAAKFKRPKSTFRKRSKRIIIIRFK